MTAIFKREFMSYFHSMTGCLVIAFTLVMNGIYFMYYNLTYGYPEMSYTLSGSAFIFLLVIPVLTMKVFAEEKKQKTDQLLLTSPVSVIQIVTGKYLAMLAVFTLPVAVIALYPLLLMRFGSIPVAAAYVALLGYFLYGSAGIAIGLFISSITESQVIAAVVTFGILIISNLMSGIQSMVSEKSSVSFLAFTLCWILICYLIYCMNRSFMVTGALAVVGEVIIAVLYVVKTDIFTGTLQTVMDYLALQDQMTNFLNKILDLKAVVYYLSVICLFLFLSVQSIQKRRWS